MLPAKGEGMTTQRYGLVAFRITPAERREISLLARLHGVSKSELLRNLVLLGGGELREAL